MDHEQTNNLGDQAVACSGINWIPCFCCNLASLRIFSIFLTLSINNSYSHFS
eukprot:Gb_22869 [translate_table: standard]